MSRAASSALALLVLVNLSLPLAACGEDDGGRTEGATGAGAQGRAPGNEARSGLGEASPQNGRKGGEDGTAPAEGAAVSREQRDPQAESIPPPTVGSPKEGAKAAAPSVPTYEDADNSIQLWGREGSSAQRLAAGTAVQTYLDARAARDWQKACGYLADKPRAELRRASQGAPCFKAMPAFAPRSTATLAREAQIVLLSLRVGPEFKTFLIYRRPDGIYAMPLTREDDEWRLYLATPTPVGG